MIPLKPDLATCLGRAGAKVEIREVDSILRMVEAELPDGDQIFIGVLPSPDISERAIQTVRRVRRRERLGGILVASTVARGSVLILVLGRDGVEGGLPAGSSEQLARRCAIETGGRVGRSPAVKDGTKLIDF